MDIALDVAAKLPSGDDDGDDDSTITTRTSKAAEDFMEEFPLTKIVVIIDTHCSESGFFLWRGDHKGEFETSPLLPVSEKHYLFQPPLAHTPPDPERLCPERDLQIPYRHGGRSASLTQGSDSQFVLWTFDQQTGITSLAAQRVSHVATAVVGYR